MFDVKRGFATGDNDYFIKTQAEWIDLGIPSTFLLPTIPSSRYIKTDTIESDENGHPKTEPQLFVFDCSLSKTELLKKYPKVYDYIIYGEKKGVNKRTLTINRVPWYKKEERQISPIIFSYAGRKESNQSSKQTESILIYG